MGDAPAPGSSSTAPQAACARIVSSPPVVPPRCLRGEQSSLPAPAGGSEHGDRTRCVHGAESLGQAMHQGAEPSAAPPWCPPGTAGRGGTPSASPAPAACPPPRTPPPECLVKENSGNILGAGRSHGEPRALGAGCRTSEKTIRAAGRSACPPAAPRAAGPPHQELFPLRCQVLKRDPAFLLQQLKGSAQTKHRTARREALHTEGTRAEGSEGQLQIWTRAETAARSPGLVLSGVP